MVRMTSTGMTRTSGMWHAMGWSPGRLEALLDTGRVGIDAYNVRGERRWALLGSTEGGRVLFVVFTRRTEKIRVVTAREAEDKEKRRYKRG